MHEQHRQRVIDRFLAEGLDGFAPHEVLELALFYCIPRRDTNAIAHRLIDEFGSLTGVAEADPRDLMRIDGVGRNTAVFLSLLPQLTRRYSADSLAARPQIRNVPEAVAYLQSLFIGAKTEELRLVCMDISGRVLTQKLLNAGTIDEVPIYSRLIVSEALKCNAAKVLLAHNHPGGKPVPSRADIELTRRCAGLLEKLDIRLVDHIVIAADGYTSMYWDADIQNKPDLVGFVRAAQYDK